MDLQVFFDIAVLNESRCLSRVSGFWLYEPEISIMGCPIFVQCAANQPFAVISRKSITRPEYRSSNVFFCFPQEPAKTCSH